MLLRILTFFKWVYGNPLTFLVGIRRIPAYHVDYTTGHIHNYTEYKQQLNVIGQLPTASSVLLMVSRIIYLFK